MHHLVPHFILQNLAQEKHSGSFPAIGLFVDISGFTSLTEMLMQYGQHGAEVLAVVIRAVFDPLVYHVHEQGGFIGYFAGDAFMAFFPLTESDAYERALAAAWLGQEQMKTQPTQVTPYGSFSLTAKAGLGIGEVQWGIIAALDEARATYYFRGTAVDEAVMAEKQAQAGNVIITPSVYEAMQAMITTRVVDEQYCVEAVKQPLPSAQPLNLPPIDLALAARFFPRHVITQAQSGEFRHVVNMFIRLPHLSEPALIRFMQTFFVLQDHYGGLLSRLDFGDKGSSLLLFWGGHQAHENDIERALSFILALQQQSGLTISAGVTQRIAHAGFNGSVLREEYTCYGRGVNLAARFMADALPGEVWLDEQVARRARAQFEMVFVGKRPFKGFIQDQPVYRLLARRDIREQPAQAGAFWGRQAELARLVDFSRPLQEGRFAGSLIIWGEAGLGKSRLVQAFLASEVASDFQIFTCQTDQILHQSFNPFRYWLRRYFDLSSAYTDAENKQRFAEKLDALIAHTKDKVLSQELRRTRSFLGSLVDLYWSGSLYDELDPKGRFENSLLGLAAFFLAESRQKPLIVLLEDVHWLDEDSHQFLGQLLRTATAVEKVTYPLAIIATARPDQTNMRLFAEPAWHTLPLAHLSTADLGHLAESLLAGPIAPNLLTLLEVRAEGNPFFAEQIVHYLQEEKLLQQTAAGWTVVTEDVRPLPEDVRTLLIARLDRLTGLVREAVQQAAVLGREFEVRLLGMMLQESEKLPDILVEAEQTAVWVALNQLRYLFKHALLRDAAYKMQLRARRQALHKLAVTAIEQLYAADLSPYYCEVAYHAENAGLTEKACLYFRQAGDVAREAYQNSQAVDYYSRSLALTADATERYQLLLAREEIFYWQGERQKQVADLTTLADLADEVSDKGGKIEVILRQARYARTTSNYAETIRAAQSAVTLAQKTADSERKAQGYKGWGEALWLQGNYTHAQENLQKALAIFRHIGQRRGEGDALFYLAEIAMKQGNYAMAASYYQQVRAIEPVMGHLQREASALNGLGLLFSHQQRYIEAQGNFQQALHIYRQIGNREGEGKALNNLGIIHHMLGQYDLAQFYYKQSLSISRQIGDQRDEAMNLNNLGEVLAKQEKYEMAIPFYENALQLEAELGLRFFAAHTNSFLGLALLALGQTADAETAFRQSLGLRQDLQQSHLMLYPQIGLAQVALRQGKSQEARQLLNEILSYLDRHDPDGLEDPFGLYWICYLLLIEFQDNRAQKILQTAHTQLQARAIKIPDEASRQSFLKNIAEHQKIMAAMAAN